MPCGAGAHHRALQHFLWPKGTTLDSRIADIDGIVPQVAAQNEEIESQVRRLNAPTSQRTTKPAAS